MRRSDALVYTTAVLQVNSDYTSTYDIISQTANITENIIAMPPNDAYILLYRFIPSNVIINILINI